MPQLISPCTVPTEYRRHRFSYEMGFRDADLALPQRTGTKFRTDAGYQAYLSGYKAGSKTYRLKLRLNLTFCRR